MQPQDEVLERVIVKHAEPNKKGLLTVSALDDNFDAVNWISNEKPWLKIRLLESGAILLRDFQIQNIAEFKVAVEQLTSNFDSFDEESSPRHSVSAKVSTSTDYPSQFPIQFHNEFSYSDAWPRYIFFFCNKPAASGGETPLADSRNVLARITAETRKRFASLGIIYHRFYSQYGGVSWQTAFGTNSQEEVIKHCEDRGIESKWDGDALRTSHRRPAMIYHPETGEELWFNHGYFFNPNALMPMALRRAVLQQGEESYSTNTTYGDGSPIAPDTIDEIRDAYENEKQIFSWQKGDLLILDNMLCSHSRNPYKGERELLVIMTDKVCRRDHE